MSVQHSVRITPEDAERLERLRERSERELGFRPSMQQALVMVIKCGLDVFENGVRHIVADLAEANDGV